MDTSRARRELRWRPQHSAAEVLKATAAAARERGLI
jgi:nucleoside-diphosphate-sugar epimerase